LPGREKDSYSIQSVENALDVLEALCEEGDEVRISHLSQKLGMNKTSVFRLLATFENRGYVEREKGSGKYRLGLSAYEMGQKILSRMSLLRKARPVMEQLVRECNEAVYLAIRRDEDVLFLDMVDTSHQVKIISLVGRHYSLSSTAAGKILQGGGPDGTAATEKRTRSRGEHPPTAQGISALRQSGACIDSGCLGEGIASVAVPLFSAGGELPGCLCFVGPDFRMTPERIETYFLPRLKEAGITISSKLGYLGHYLGGEFL
jgi:IclR family KDG regulon transcriptional repressor